MAYQNVGTPVFYLNMLEWYNSQGSGNEMPDVLRTLPVQPKVLTSIVPTTASSEFVQSNIVPFPSGIDKFVAILGHNLNSSESSFRIGIGSYANHIDHTEYINMDTSGVASYDGFSIININTLPYGANSFWFDIVGTPAIGSIIVGTKYTMPHSPDLNLTMTREYGGIKTIETKGGASLSNAFYTKPPAWGDLGAWEVGGGDPKLSKSGRRVWGLSFSYLADSSVFPDVSALRNFEIEGYSAGDDSTVNTLLFDNNFYSQVIHKTNGGQLPFIFQPDKDNSNPDQFAICKFDQSSFSFQQQSPSLYSCKMKIREVW
tara:strand:+ start:1387 stop:2334 length:948 start_codon:yes stop_codon:yes gene_type:complete